MTAGALMRSWRANNVDDQMEALLEITGVPPGPLADLKPTVPLKPPTPASLDEWTETALTNNPAIISAKYDVDIAKKEIDVSGCGRLTRTRPGRVLCTVAFRCGRRYRLEQRDRSASS